jgi:hypothetical protein
MVLRAPLVLVLFTLTTSGLPAQSATTTPAATPRRTRAVSAAVAAALAAEMPKYAPPKPAAPEAEEDLTDQRDIDKPRNQIIRLPDYVVREKRPPVFRSRDINTTKGLGELALKRYFSETGRALNRFTLPLIGMSPEAYALMLYAEDERLENIAGLKAIAADLKALGTGQSEAIGRETDRTYIRTDGFGYQKPK